MRRIKLLLLCDLSLELTELAIRAMRMPQTRAMTPSAGQMERLARRNQNGPTVRNRFGTLIHRALIAVDVQDAMNGVLSVLALVVGLLLLGNAKHPGISPDRLCVKGETQQTAKKQASLDTPASSPGPTFEAARWYALLDSLEDTGPKEGSTFWR